MLAAAIVLITWRWSQTLTVVEDPPPSHGKLAAQLVYRIDPNHATPAQLAALPGLGPARAADILADRRAGPSYTSADDLTRIKGIGAAMVNKLRPHLVFPAEVD